MVVSSDTVGDGDKHCCCICGWQVSRNDDRAAVVYIGVYSHAVSTWYKITADGYLIAHCSIFPEKKISISEISAVEVTVMPVSSYALSLDRLIIYKGDTQWLLISPVNKQDFVKLLKKHNPDIRIKEPVI